MIERMVSKLVSLLLQQNMITEEQKEQYVYAMICQIETSITTLSVLAISIMIQKVIPTICFLLFFFSLRKRTGGYHLNSFRGCYIGTMCVYGITVYLCALLEQFILLLGILVGFASICVAVIGTINHPNMNMDSVEFDNAKKAARLMLGMQILVIILLSLADVNATIIIFSAFGIVLCAVLLCVAKITEQEVKMNG